MVRKSQHASSGLSSSFYEATNALMNALPLRLHLILLTSQRHFFQTITSQRHFFQTITSHMNVGITFPTQELLRDIFKQYHWARTEMKNTKLLSVLMDRFFSASIFYLRK
jgi:hypothetical protein